jgi:hypothetical protein
MNRFPLAALAALTFLATPVRADDNELVPAKPVKVAFELLPTKHMAVKITLNGKGPYRVIFDTGAPVTLLNTRIAQDSGLEAKGTKPQSFFGIMAPRQVEIKTLGVGDLKADKVPAIIMDHPTVEVMHQAFGPIEGIVGFPFFARYAVTLDYQAKEMTFKPNGYKPADIMQNMDDLMKGLFGGKKPERKVVAPAALWGLVVHKQPGDEEAGVTVKEVLPDSAAAKAGLKAGDRLLTMDGRWTDTVADCYAAASYVKPATTVTVVVRRDGKELEVSVTPTAGL